MDILKYKYYDSPEGQDCLGKMVYMSKWAAYFGLTAAVTDIVLLSHPKGYVQTAGRLIYYIGPITGMAATFAATACIANSIRGKDDYKNYVCGAVASASVYGAWQKNLASGIRASIWLSIAAYFKKMSVEEGWVFFPEVKRETPFLLTRHIDYSKVKGMENK